jgi:hypothetical protein
MVETPVTLERVEAVLRDLPPQQLKAVLLFAEFVRERTHQEEDEDEEELWSLIESDRAYRVEHPDEVETYSTAEEMLAALGDAA